MTVAVGEEVYVHGAAPCVGRGLTWSDDDLDAAISNSVAAVVFDDEGAADISDLLTGVAETDFEQHELARVLSGVGNVEDWRVGEAIAETYLTDHRDCSFPWPDGRDARKRTASLPGADLVGFQMNKDGDRFAFGEVKTSGEERHPPQAMYGRTGLKQQLEDLRDRCDIRDDLMKYLGYRAKAAPWKERYQAASKRYLANSSDVHLFGILIRDVQPHIDDVKARVANLTNDCPEGTAIELIAIYLPKGTIEDLGARALATQEGASA